MKFFNNDFQNLILDFSLPINFSAVFFFVTMTTQFDEFKNFLQRVQFLNMSPKEPPPEYLNLPPKTNDDELNFIDEKEMTNIKVTVGIDEDLKMILEMDPSIMDLGDGNLDQPKVLGLPPITGG